MQRFQSNKETQTHCLHWWTAVMARTCLLSCVVTPQEALSEPGKTLFGLTFVQNSQKTACVLCGNTSHLRRVNKERQQGHRQAHMQAIERSQPRLLTFAALLCNTKSMVIMIDLFKACSPPIWTFLCWWLWISNLGMNNEYHHRTSRQQNTFVVYFFVTNYNI